VTLFCLCVCSPRSWSHSDCGRLRTARGTTIWWTNSVIRRSWCGVSGAIWSSSTSGREERGDQGRTCVIVLAVEQSSVFVPSLYWDLARIYCANQPWKLHISCALPLTSCFWVRETSPIVITWSDTWSHATLDPRHRGYTRTCLRIIRTSTLEALCYKPEGRWFETRWGHWIFFDLPNNPSSRSLARGFIQPLTQMNTRKCFWE
jgi:hypothetical protein